MGLEEYLVLGVQFESQPPILPAVTSWLPYCPSPSSSWPQLLWNFFFIPIYQTRPLTLSSFFIQPKLHGASLQTLFFPPITLSFAEPTSQNHKPMWSFYVYFEKIIEDSTGKRKSHLREDKAPNSVRPSTLSKLTFLCPHFSMTLHV